MHDMNCKNGGGGVSSLSVAVEDERASKVVDCSTVTSHSRLDGLHRRHSLTQSLSLATASAKPHNTHRTRNFRTILSPTSHPS